MKTQKKDLFHGSALTQIVEHPSFKALNKASDNYGHYRVNNDIEVFCKYRTGHHQSKTKTWYFCFQPEEKIRINHVPRDHKLFVCLVCGDHTVCVLNRSELQNALNLNDFKGQYLKVEIPKGGSCHVPGIKLSIPHKAFPEKIFSDSYFERGRCAA